MLDIFTSRKVQLELERKIDTEIKKSTECPGEIITYYLLRREINYEQFQNVNATPFWNKPRLMMKYLEKNEQHLVKMNQRLESEKNICKVLKYYNEGKSPPIEE